MRFEWVTGCGRARLGRLVTDHGTIDTPAFMPVGTLGAVMGVGPERLRELGASVMLANLYHLEVRPGVELIERLGGLHTFAGWHLPIATDSGGYQVMSLASRRLVSERGVTFRAHHDGRAMSFTPEDVVRWQERLGVDLAMVLDECPPWPVTAALAQAALERTNRWAERARVAWTRPGTALFGIVQGSFFPDLRARAAREIVALDFPGYAIGGVAVGEGRGASRAVVEQVAELLPPDRPRYLMGLGTPADLVHAVAAGVDLFDCVLPTRNARHGVLYTSAGILKIGNRRYRDDPRPIDPKRPRPGAVSRAFLHHLFRCGELTAKVLATEHNLLYYLDFMADLRQSLLSGTFADWAAHVLAAEA